MFSLSCCSYRSTMVCTTRNSLDAVEFATSSMAESATVPSNSSSKICRPRATSNSPQVPVTSLHLPEFIAARTAWQVTLNHQPFRTKGWFCQCIPYTVGDVIPTVSWYSAGALMVKFHVEAAFTGMSLCTPPITNFLESLGVVSC